MTDEPLETTHCSSGWSGCERGDEAAREELVRRTAGSWST